MAEPQTGQAVGMTNSRASSGRFSSTGASTSGITSPARRTMTVSPMRTSLRRISSSLCSVALVTVTPPTNTGLSRATGVMAPVRPTCTSMSSSVVVASSAANLCASAAARAPRSPALSGPAANPLCRPRRRCRRGTRAHRADLGVEGHQVFGFAGAVIVLDVDGQAQGGKPLQHGAVGLLRAVATLRLRPRRPGEQAALRARQALHLAPAVGEKAQRPLGGDARVQLAQAAAAALRGLTNTFSSRLAWAWF